ncbi:hypothetical protein [Microbispora sp. H10885]|uniref:hypothetical protein n=1 Tax=Microbispora sp. H10885 TaxID=2729110 RepID=UPI0016045227|nr:hypothetical protein [Microbispora sp. H10885]
MKRAFMALACAATAALVAPAVAAPAHAQTPTGSRARPANPVAALKKQFVPGRGVRVVSSARLNYGGLIDIKSGAKGVVGFGRSGVASSDITTKTNYGGGLGDDDELKGLNDPMRTITVGRTSYVSGGIYADLLPDGKSWLRLPGQDPDAALTGLGGFVNPLDPRALQAVLATTRAKGAGGVVNGARTTLYRGTITVKQLAAAVPSLRKGLPSSMSKGVISWRLWIGGDQLVRKVSSSLTTTLKVKKTSIGIEMSSTTAYGGWGGKVTVKAPPKDQVASTSDIDGSVPDLPQVIDLGD